MVVLRHPFAIWVVKGKGERKEGAIWSEVREPSGEWTRFVTKEPSENEPSSGPYAAFEVEGPLDHAAVGILAALLAPLSEARIPVFVVSTFRTDWILCPQEKSSQAETAWELSGHLVRSA